jgi:Flp pilus assembly protein TadG
MFRRMGHDQSGAAVVEMALIAPFMIVLMFGCVELGNYFYCEHVVVKAVRDGARYASRQGFVNFTCPDQIDATTADNTKRVTRTNQVASGGSSRLPGWTNDSTVAVTVTCDDSGTYNSFFDGLTEIPVVKVSATVPYASIFGEIGFPSIGLNLYAESQAPVMGA